MSVQVVFGKKQKSYTSHVEQNGTFFLQLDTKEAYGLPELSERIANHIKATGQTRMIPEYGLTCFAFSKAYKAWYRALICNRDPQKVQVFYVDYGNTEFVNTVNPSADAFFEMAYQSVCCTVANFIPASPDFGTKLRPLILERETSCVFLSKSGSQAHPYLPFLPCYNALLYENETSANTLADYLVKKNLGHYAICLDTVEVGSKQNVIVSFVDSPGKFWVQLSKDYDTQQEIMEKLNSSRTIASLSPLPQSAVREGVSCCSLYAEDGRYYRAEIDNVKANGKLKVWFGDYGNTETVSSKDVMTLPRELTRTPFGAIVCSLDGVLPVRSNKPHPKLGNIAWTPEAGTAFGDIVLENEYEAEFVGEISTEIYSVRLADPNTGQSVGEMLAKAGIVQLSDEEIADSHKSEYNFNYSTLEVGQTYHVFVTHVRSPSSVWCQLPEFMTKMEKLEQLLPSVASSVPALIDPDIGMPCCAPYEKNGSWNRGVIVDIGANSQKAQVLFVDYGNVEKIDYHKLKILPSELIVLPAQAICLCIAAPVSYKWIDSQQASEYLASLIEEQELDCTVVGRADNEGHAFELPCVFDVNVSYSNQPGSDIGEELVKRGFTHRLSQPPISPPRATNMGVVPSAEATIVSQDHFEYLSLDVGQTYQKVYITHVESPGVVWCQRPEYASKMEELANKLESVAPSLSAITTTPELDSPCCALYSQDQSWYRAVVECIDSSGKTAQVLFVDYGNTEQVSRRNLKSLPSEFLKLPAQAISFSIASITPPNDADWSEEACEFVKALIADQEMDCSVVELDADGYPAVRLSNHLQPNSDVGQELVRRGYAVGQIPSQPSVPKSSDETKPHGLQVAQASSQVAQTCTQSTLSYEKVSLKPGTTYNVTVSHVESLTEFYCQLKENSVALDELMASIDNYCNSSKSSAAGNATPNLPVLAMYSADGAWYRAQVQSIDGEMVSVKFVDYGNSEPVNESSLKKAASEFLQLPSQAIQCALHGVVENRDDAITAFSDMTLEQPFSLALKQITDQGVAVADLITDDESTITQQLIQSGLLPALKPVSSPKPAQNRVDIQPPRFNINTPTSAVISNIESPFRFHIQINDNHEILQRLLDEVHNFYSENGKSFVAEEGLFCVAKYSEDAVWYRARITSVSANQVNVEFVDYGNSETTAASGIKSLEPHFLSDPCLAVPCHLHGLSEGQSNKELVETFSNLVFDKELTVEFLEHFKSFETPVGVKMRVGDIDILQACLKLAGPQQAELVPLTPKLGNLVACQISFVVSCNEFYCQLSSEMGDFVKFMDELYSFYEGKQGYLKNVTVGTYCAAPYTDGSWYRGLVTANTPQGVSVFYCDYGNSELVPLIQLKELDPNFLSKPIQAIKCTLGDQRFDSEECKATFEKAVLEKDVQVVFHERLHNECFKTTVIADNVDICQLLSSSSPSAAQPPSLSTAKPPPLNTPVQCTVSFINSCSDFYCQLAATSEALDDLMNNLYAFYEEGKGIPLTTPTPGLNCAVPFTDGSWYRGIISALSDKGATVHYIDYGNVDCVSLSDIHQLNQDYCQLPVQAICCSLVGSTSDKDTERFQEFALEQQVKITFVKQMADRYEVKLAKNGVSFKNETPELLKLEDEAPIYERTSSLQIRTLSPELSMSSPLECTVSYVASCDEFYCQLSTFNAEFEDLMNNLYTYYGEEGKGSVLASPALGAYCAAPFADDGSWYRGVITHLNAQTASVFYMDYGNAADLELSSLRLLEAQFCTLPIQAVHSSLPPQFSSPKCTKAFNDAVLNQVVEVTFVEQLPSGSFLSKLQLNGEDIEQILIPFVPKYQLAASIITIPRVRPECGPFLKCTVTYIVSVAEFYCQLSSQIAQLDTLMAKLYAFYAESEECRQLANPAVGSLCAVPYTDGSWYRGQIEAIADDSAQILYIDYGNSDTVPLAHVQELEPQFSGLDIQVVKCCLKDLSPTAKSECEVKFQELVLENEVLAIFEPSGPGDLFFVTMEVNGRSLNEVLIEAGVAASPRGKKSPPKTNQILPLSIRPSVAGKVLITTVNSSTEFYCQLINQQESLDLLMLKIRTFCEVSESSLSRESQWKEREFVLARFTEDESWYRAQIVQLNGDGTAKIFYVDYGNSEVLNVSELKKIAPEFCQLPAQAIKCALEGSLAFTHTEKSYEQWNDLLLNQEMMMKCVSVKSDGTCYVDLERLDTGADVLTLAIAEKVFSPRTIDPAVEPTEKNIGVTSLQTSADSVQVKCEYPAELTPNSFHNVSVQYVESPSLFYSQFGQFHRSQLQTLMNLMQDHYTSNSGLLYPLTSCTKGCFLAAQFSEDELWYRCQVEEVEKAGVFVRFIDYGNCETVPVDKLRFLDPEFAKLPAQGIPCSLALVSPVESDEWSDDAINTFASLVLEKDSMGEMKASSSLARKQFAYNGVDAISIILKDDDVVIGDELIRRSLACDASDGLGGSSQKSSTVYSEFIKPVAGESSEMYVSHIDSPAQFWLQMPTADDILALLQSELGTTYEEQENVVFTEPEIGNACCTKFSGDRNWYRAVVTGVSPEGVTVRFVDYGNSEIVDPTQVFVLDPNFLSTPVQAVQCSLSSIPDSAIPMEATSKFSALVMDKELLVTFDNQMDSNKWEVTVQESGQDVGKSLFPVTELVEKISEMTIQSITVPTLGILVDETYPVYISFGNSPSKFFCQLVSESEKLEALMAEVSDFYSEHQLEVNLTVGTYCVAKYSGTWSWYRARITAVHSTADIEVTFLDYGNSEHVTSKQISGLDTRFSELPAQGIPCSLIQDLTMEFPSEVLAQFFQYDLDQQFKIKIRNVIDGTYIVDLYDQGGSHVNASILGMLLSPPVSSPSTDGQSYVHLKFEVGSSLDTFISSVNSPTSFYCQPLDLAADLDQLMSEISSLMASSALPPIVLAEATPGKICLAQFSKDNAWYRAVVKGVNGIEVTVLYVDYGNTEVTTVDKIVELPEQFRACVVQAIHCSAFEGLDREMDWSEEQIGQFQELVSQSDHITATITNISPAGQYSVEVSANGEAIDFSFLLEQQIEKIASEPQPPQRSLASGPAGLVELSMLPKDGSAASSASLGSGSETAETETDNGSVGEPLIKAPFKLSLAVEESLDVNVVYVQSPSLFYIQRADCQAELDNLSEEIAQHCASLGESHREFPQKGDYVLAKYAVDEAWYRAEVNRVDSEDGTTEVSFIDYGNVELVAPQSLIMCPANFLELPAQAIPCSLARVPRRDSWPFEYKDLINSLVEGKVLRATVEVPGSQGMRPNVKLVDKQTDMDLADKVLLKLQDEFEVGSDNVIVELPEGENSEEEDSALPKPTPETAVQEVEPEPSSEALTTSSPGMRLLKEREWVTDSTHPVIVQSCEHPHSFICQLANEGGILESVTAQLLELPTDSQLEIKSPLREGDILAAQFSDDLAWYRARVESSSSDGHTKVTFIDFGNSETVTQDKLRFLPPSLLSHPPLAVECFLNGLEPCSAEGVFHEDATTKFLELVGEGEATIQVVSVDTAGHVGVRLTTSARVDVGNALVECKLASPLVPSPQTSSVASSTKQSDESLPEEKEEPIISPRPSPVEPAVRVEEGLGDDGEKVVAAHSGQSEVGESPTHLANTNMNNSQDMTLYVLTTSPNDLARVEEVYTVAATHLDTNEEPNNSLFSARQHLEREPVTPESDSTLSETVETEDLVPAPVTPDSDSMDSEQIEPVPVTPDFDTTGSDEIEPVPGTPDFDTTGSDRIEPAPVTPDFDTTMSDQIKPAAVTPDFDTTGSDQIEPAPVTHDFDTMGSDRIEPAPVTPDFDTTGSDQFEPAPVTPDFDTTESDEVVPTSIIFDSNITECDQIEPIHVSPDSHAVTTEWDGIEPGPVTPDSDSAESSAADTTKPVLDAHLESLSPTKLVQSVASIHESDTTKAGCLDPVPDSHQHSTAHCLLSSPVYEQGVPKNTKEGFSFAENLFSMNIDQALSSSVSDPPLQPSPHDSLNTENGALLDIQGNTNGNNNKDYAESLPVQSLTPGVRYPLKTLSIYSPEEFVCVLKDKADSLKQLTTELAQTVDSLPAAENLVSGVPVAVLRDGEWCRAVVLSVGVLLDIVTVFCVDNGCSDMVSPSKLKPLLKKHAHLPPQAVKCQLSILTETDINPDLVVQGEPWELTWPVSCTHHLTQLTQNRSGLYIEIQSSNSDDVYEVRLLDCSKEPAIDLRQILVEKLCNPTKVVLSSPSQPLEHVRSFDDDARVHEDSTQPLTSDRVHQIAKDVEAITVHSPPTISGKYSSIEVSPQFHTTEHSDSDKPSSDQPKNIQKQALRENVFSEAQADSDFIDGETSASTGEGDTSTGKVSTTESAESVSNSYSEPVDQSSESTLQDHASEGSFVIL